MSEFVITDCSDVSITGFRTSRLTARRMETADEAWLAELHSDAEMMSQMGGTRTAAQNREWLATNLAHWDGHGFGQWMLALANVPNTPIGRGGLRMIDPFVREDVVEIGYAFAVSAWGQGYATEVSLAFVRIAFEHYGMDQLGAITLETNTASQNVLAKVGFVYEHDIEHPTGLHRFYRLLPDAPECP